MQQIPRGADATKKLLYRSSEGTEDWWHYTTGFSARRLLLYCRELDVFKPRTLLL